MLILMIVGRYPEILLLIKFSMTKPNFHQGFKNLLTMFTKTDFCLVCIVMQEQKHAKADQEDFNMRRSMLKPTPNGESTI